VRRILPSVIVCLLGFAPAFAGYTVRKMQSAMRSAEKGGKAVAFIFYEDFLQDRKPHDVDAANARNNAAKKAIPRVSINKGDKEIDQLPACFSREDKTPQGVISAAKGEKVIVEYQGVSNREKEEDIEKKVDAARAQVTKEVFI